MTNKTTLLLPALLGAGIGIHTAGAAEIPTNTAQMQAMDKITGRVNVINVPVNAEMRFGSFSIVVRDCRTRSPEETPENFAFVDVADTVGENQQVNIFKGWMLSSSPALNAVEHPVYDVWLLKCIDTDISNLPLMSAEELAARDQLPMQRPEVREVSAPQEENGFEEVNLSGEPIDLLPAAVREAGEENAAQEQIIKLEAEKDVIAEENAPQSLLNIPEQPAAPDDEEIKEIKAQIEIRENAAEGGESEIKSDARVLSLPQPAAAEQPTEETVAETVGEAAFSAVVAEPQPAAQMPENTAADISAAATDADAATHKAPVSEEIIEPSPTDNGIDPDILSELEKELSGTALDR